MIEPGDVLRHLAIAAGYRVHVWEAVENGDPADSYFWKAARPNAAGQQSASTFSSTGDAWRDCCEANGLLTPIARELEHAGWTVVRVPGFIAYRWIADDGQVSPRSFVSAAEALISCAMHLADSDEETELHEPGPTAGIRV
jgi:hypothetical protein